MIFARAAFSLCQGLTGYVKQVALEMIKLIKGKHLA